MNYSQKYTLVTFLEPIKVGAEFKMTEWPLHITLADVFAIELNINIQQKLAHSLLAQPSFGVSVGEDATLGTTTVALINNDRRLKGLHNKIVDLLESNGAIFNTPEFTRVGFLPHVTIQKSERLKTGDEVEIISISLVDMYPNSDWRQRKVLSNFNLKQA